MWTRAELKSRAKEAFKRNYWKCVLAALVLALITSNSSSSSTEDEQSNNVSWSRNSEWTGPNAYPYGYGTGGIHQRSHHGESILRHIPVLNGVRTFGIGALTTFAVLAAFIAVIFFLLLGILVFGPLEVGCQHFFIENAWHDHAGPGHLLYAFKNGNYGTVVITMLLRQLYIFLWTLLLVIPGIIKAYEYRMVPYLLADDPNMTREKAFRLSREMMDGMKWEAFVLDLSFLGWNILSGITFGLLGLFYVNPYQYATNAELYLALRN